MAKVKILKTKEPAYSKKIRSETSRVFADTKSKKVNVKAF